MAESFLFSIAESLVAKLASRAFEEASRVVGLYEDLQDLTKTLSVVKAVLLDAQQKQDHNHQLREWLSQLKTIFSDAEDVLDEFECQTLRKRVVKAHGSTKDKVSHFFSTSNPLVFRYKMAQQIKDISKRLDKVAADRHKFSLQINDVDTRVVHRRDMTHSRVSDSDVIGRKHDKEKTIELLTQQNSNDADTKGLSEEDSLSLFVKWAFKEGEEEKHPHLINIGRQIVKKCRGVPLAVRTLGSLLFSKFEDSKIVSYEITSLWVALGLVAQPKSNRTREDVANQYLHELLSRSFLQDFESFGTFSSFAIHDLLHDVALFVATDECLHVSSNIIQNIPDHVQHLSFAESSLFANLVTKKSTTVRTVLFPNDATAVSGKVVLNTCVSKLKCLRVLDLRGSTFETLPHTIAKLKHLRYLNISRNRNIKRLPNSICNLQSLQVLKLTRCTELEALPEGLRKLISLRDFAFSTKQTVLSMNEIANLGSLERLTISSCPNVESIFGGVKFPSLKTLSVEHCESLKSLSLDGQNFPELETLIVEGCHNLDSELWKGGHEKEGPELKLKVVAFVTLTQLVVLPKWLQKAANSLQFLILLCCFNIETFPDWFYNSHGSENTLFNILSKIGISPR
ncbi:disease resistance protein RPM1 [Vigna unguiculata]|uniref:Disease resistance protein RPM1 n=1 Tax=Vigna unguiculata TaxID=3917 RepID=A0A4D6M7V2_VIGUN|nr:disease resistance protein RPM1 [Vigna unguiculata]